MNNTVINPARDNWSELIKRPVFDSQDLEPIVMGIINNVKRLGDQAVKNYSSQFQGFSPDNLWVNEDEIREAALFVNKGLQKAILLAKKNIEKFHLSQAEKVKKITTITGVTCWRKSVPIEKVGLYIPGGSAPLFSTLLMLAIPAKIAGCKNILVATPVQNDGRINNVLLYVASILGIDKIYKSGGAQAIAAMAYGTET
ncbi:MAG: histidinol dehydrogenase, partial [Ginsengibacter sp.]